MRVKGATYSLQLPQPAQQRVPCRRKGLVECPQSAWAAKDKNGQVWVDALATRLAPSVCRCGACGRSKVGWHLIPPCEGHAGCGYCMRRRCIRATQLCATFVPKSVYVRA